MDLSAVNPEIDDQGAELSLIAAVMPSLDERTGIDVGSERGAVAASLRDAGLDTMWLIEPFPGNAARLRERFGGDPGVHVLEMAAGAKDGTAELHLARDVSGDSLDAFHTLRPEQSGPDLVWDGSVEVEVRSLDSLREAGEIPERVGLLKIDAEGADADVLRGARGIKADVVMVEFWGDLPDTLGPCPVGLEELRSLVEVLGPSRFLFVHHGPRHVSLGRWDAANPGEGEWGNLIFLADSLVDAAEAALPELDRGLRERGEKIVAEQERAAAERLELIERLTDEAEARLELVERVTREADVRGRLVERLRGRRSRDRSGASGEAPRLDELDDVEQEGGGGGAV
ncbi:MAG TPA: FkbM family methyltransferase [Solirubrobacterales bacterium]|nr:FkbM family methyltransferase [Solirubrobacterales bacterium]